MGIKNGLIFSILNLIFMTQTFSSFRELLIFGEADNMAIVGKQMAVLQKDNAGIKERAIKIIVVKKESSLYKKYQIKPGSFMVVLIGKDNSEKYRSETIISTDQLFAIIDAMPMRKAEIKKQGN